MKTVSFLRSLQKGDGRFDSIKVAYYVFKTLTRLGFSLTIPYNYLTDQLEEYLRRIRDTNVYADVSSNIEIIYFTVEMLKSLRVQIHSNRVISEILSLENVDGSFGKAGYSKIASTYYSLSTLSMLGYDLNRFGNTLNWIRRCEVPSGGFVGSTESSSTYIVMEDIYFGLKTLEILHENCRYPNETLKVIAKFQNPNGGFRRSIFLGISDFESTYQALSCIKTILQQHQEKREYGMNLEGDGVRLRS